MSVVVVSAIAGTSDADITGVTAGTGATGGGTSGTVTIGVDVGTGPNQIVQLTAASKLPAVDGSLLTNVVASSFSGTLPVVNGGTGQTSFTNGQLLIGNTSGNTLAKAALTAGAGITITNGAGTITITVANATLVSKTANYTIISTDSTILCDSSGAAFNLTLPDPSTVTGRRYQIIDKTGSFGTNNVTLVRFGSEKIAGLNASRPLSANWGYYNLTSDGTDWYLG